MLTKKLAPVAVALSSALAISIFSLLANAAESSSDSALHSLYKGSKALLFQVNGGYLFAGKYHLQANRALELYLGLNTNASKTDYSPETSGTNGHSYGHSLFAGVRCIIYRRPIQEFAPFMALGPEMRWSYSRYRTDDEQSDYVRRTTTRSRTWQAGITGHIGFEWFVVRRVSLIGQYGVSVAYLWADADRYDYTYRQNHTPEEQSDEYASHNRQFRFDYDNVQLRLALYF
jgi:hypothetical protein